MQEYVWNIIQSNPQRYLQDLSPDEMVEEVRVLSKEKFDEVCTAAECFELCHPFNTSAL